MERGYFWDAAWHALAGAGDEHGGGGDYGEEGDRNVVDDDGDGSLFLIHQLNSVKSCTSVSESFHRRKELTWALVPIIEELVLIILYP